MIEGGNMLNLLKLAALAAALAWTVGAPAQTYPSKPIRWIVPYTPGGITDNVTRVVTQRVQEQTGWNIVVENKPGANSILGADLVAKSAPDGYTFLTVIAAHAANATLYAGKIPYDPVKSFAPVSLAAIAPLIMTANNNLPVKDAKELIAYAKANPGKISFGSSGIGAAAHLTTELFKQTAGVDMVHIPYKGTAGALQDLMGGNLQILVDTPSADAACARRQDQGNCDVLQQAPRRRCRGAYHGRGRRPAAGSRDLGYVSRACRHAA
jgi:tripartite-type tricarboxylate transporter receptor subunit TctC